MNRIMITEATGYLGLHLTQELRAQGIDVMTCDPKAIVTSDAGLAPALSGIDVVICLLPDGGNDLMFPQLLRLMAGNNIRRLVLESSLHVYGEGLYTGPSGHLLQPHRRLEDLQAGRWDLHDGSGVPLTPLATHEMANFAPFSAQGILATARERLAQDWATAGDHHLCILRLSQLFGLPCADGGLPSDDIFRMLNDVEAGQCPEVAEDGGQIQDFIHVRDAARAIRLSLSRHDGRRGAVNIASGRGYRSDDVARLVASAAFRYDLTPRPTLQPRPDLPRHLVGMTNAAEEYLGFTAEHPLENSLGEIVHWFRSLSASNAPNAIAQA